MQGTLLSKICQTGGKFGNILLTRYVCQHFLIVTVNWDEAERKDLLWLRVAVLVNQLLSGFYYFGVCCQGENMAENAEKIDSTQGSREMGEGPCHSFILVAYQSIFRGWVYWVYSSSLQFTVYSSSLLGSQGHRNLKQSFTSTVKSRERMAVTLTAQVILSTLIQPKTQT